MSDRAETFTVSFSGKEELKARVFAAAKKQRRSASNLVCLALEWYLQNHPEGSDDALHESPVPYRKSAGSSSPIAHQNLVQVVAESKKKLGSEHKQGS